MDPNDYKAVLVRWVPWRKLKSEPNVNAAIDIEVSDV